MFVPSPSLCLLLPPVRRIKADEIVDSSRLTIRKKMAYFDLRTEMRGHAANSSLGIATRGQVAISYASLQKQLSEVEV